MDTGTIVWAELNIRSQPLQVIQRLDPFLLSSDVFESATAHALTAAAWTSARDLAKGEECACQVLQKLKNSSVDAKSAKALGRACLVLAEVNHDRGDADACVRYMLLCRQQLEVSLSPGLQGGLHLLEAAVARKKGDLEAVRSGLESALMAFDEAGDRAAVAGTMNNLAVFHREQGNNADALRLHIESASISRAMEDWINVARNEYNQALLLRSSADFEGALALMESSLAVMKNLAEVRGEAHVLNGLGSLHLDLKQFEQARFCFQKSLAIKQNLKLVNDQAVAWVNLAQTCQGAGNWEEADSALNHAYQLTLETGNAHLRWSIYLGFALQAVQAQDAKGALENFSEALNQTQQLGQQNEALECAEAFYDWVLDQDPIVFRQVVFQGSCATLLARLEPSQIELELEDRIGTARRIGHKVRELGFMHLSARFLAKHAKYREAFAALQDWHQAQAEYARQTAESKLESLSIRYELAEARSKAELERIRNEELAKALNSSRELQKQKDYFMAIVAHDLRNPLIGIRNAAQALNQSATQADTHLLLSIADTASSGLALINDLLDLDKLEQSGFALAFESVDPRQIFDDVVRNLAWQIKEKQVRVHWELKIPPVWADRNRLAQVFQNVIQNAVSFSPVGGTVRVDAHTLPGTVRILIKDQGPGVPPALRERLFEKYSIANDKSEIASSRVSSGLGLAVAAGFISAMHGKIYLSQEQGWGAVFCIEIPRFDAASLNPQS